MNPAFLCYNVSKRKEVIMKKFWVNVLTDARNKFPHDAECVAVYGTLKDAEDYAYTYMCNHYFGFNLVKIFDEQMNLIKEYEV